jgi:hypothetical protein
MQNLGRIASRQILRPVSALTTNVRKVTDNPPFYGMVIKFSEEAAFLLEDKLLADEKVELGKDQGARNEQLKDLNR